MTDQELVELAFTMLERSYVPYSHFPVGAALECADGTVFTGCNVENAAYGSSICAERTALVKAVSEGHRDDFTRIASLSNSTEPCWPCGACRQMLYEFAPGLTVLVAQRDHSFVLPIILLTHGWPQVSGVSSAPLLTEGTASSFILNIPTVCTAKGGPMAPAATSEETVAKILDVSMRLFTEQGYEHTTIQDIVDALGMSKGAIYHHFKSRRILLDRINDRCYAKTWEWFSDPAKLPGRNGLEKLRHAFRHFLTDPAKREVDRLAIHHIVKNPKIALLTLESTFRDAAPYVEGMIRLGMADGTLPGVTHPTRSRRCSCF